MSTCQPTHPSARRPLHRRHRVLRYFFAAAIAATGVAHAQPEPASPAASTASPETTPPNVAAPAAIPLAEMAPQAESAFARLRDLQAELSSDRITEEVAKQLPALTREIDARLRESRKILAQRPSLEILESLERDWRRLRNHLANWTRDLTSRATQLERDMAELNELEKVWDQTLKTAKDSKAPAEVLRRIEAVIGAIRQAREAVDRQRSRALTMQNRVAVQDARIADVLTAIAEARDDVLNRLFVKDSPPIWSTDVRSQAARDLPEESRNSFFTQWAALRSYVERQALQFFIHAGIFVALVSGFYHARRRLRSEGSPGGTTPVFERPFAAALLLSFLLSRWIYPQAPRLLSAILGAFTLIPSVLILRRLIGRDLYPLLYALVVFYFVDQVRTVAAAIQVLPRVLFLTEILGAMGFLLWLIVSMSRAPRSTAQAEPLRKTAQAALYVALAFCAVAFTANAVGYVTLANLLGNALLSSAYLALILYALVEVLDGLVMIALGLRPLALLSIVRQHGPLLRHRIRKGMQWLAVFLWGLFVLERLLLRERLFRAIQEILTAELSVGSLHISLGDVLAFGITVWAAFLVSRFVRFMLEEDVYPRVRLKRGLPYAISTTLHYVILLVGFFAAVAALGLDMTKVTILAGAFSVGVGFGLQNIFNNFVSGLILLFERPVNIGDVVQIEDTSGVVESIGIRASIIRTVNGSEVIVPNGKLISERLTNWTLSNRQHGIELPVAVALGTDPRRVINLLERIAADHPLVTGDPPPQALVVKLGPDSLTFELRAWTDRSEQWMLIRSELAIAVSAALTAEKIAIR
jgi:potassium efflux system protein